MSDAPSATGSGSSRFADGKAQGAMRTIGEVSQALGIKPHVLRYWEQQFPMLQPLKRSGGRRLYRPDDIAMVERIDRLVNQQGYTLKGACAALESGAGGASEAVAIAHGAASVAPVASDHETLRQLRHIRERLANALAA